MTNRQFLSCSWVCNTDFFSTVRCRYIHVHHGRTIYSQFHIVLVKVTLERDAFWRGTELDWEGWRLEAVCSATLFLLLFFVLFGERDFQINLEWIENIAGDVGLDFVKVCLSYNRILFLPPTFIIIIIALYLGSIHCRRHCMGFECCWWEQRLMGTIRLYHSLIPGFIHWAI